MASVVIYSVVDRPINNIFINGNMGNNAAAFDGFSASGGRGAGPYRIEGDNIKIDWVLSTTMAQYEEQAHRSTAHTVSLPMPTRIQGQNDFCVLFLPHNKPMVKWAHSCVIEMDANIDTYRARTY